MYVALSGYGVTGHVGLPEHMDVCKCTVWVCLGTCAALVLEWQRYTCGYECLYTSVVVCVCVSLYMYAFSLCVSVFLCCVLCACYVCSVVLCIQITALFWCVCAYGCLSGYVCAFVLCAHVGVFCTGRIFWESGPPGLCQGPGPLFFLVSSPVGREGGVCRSSPLRAWLV